MEKIDKSTPLGRSRIWWIDGIAKDPRAIYQNITLDFTYNRERQRDLMKAAMVLNGPV